MVSNFSFLAQYWAELAQIGSNAEAYLYSDPNVCIYKLGLFAERIVSEICRFESVLLPEEARQVDKIRILYRDGLLPDNIRDILTALRKARNDAVHAGLNTGERAKTLLRMAYSLSVWFMEVYGNWEFTPIPYQEPENNSDSADYQERLKEQEAKLRELSEQIAEIKTAVSDLPHEERRKKAADTSKNLPLSEAETAYLTAEQLHMDASILPVVNFALQQNHVPVVQSITINNPSDHPLENVELRITANPALCLPYSKHLEVIPAKNDYVVRDISLILDADYLASLTEKVTGMLNISLATEGTLLCEEQVELTALAFDEWHGYLFYPELLTAFVTPNHPEMIKINARAAELLGKWTGDPSLDAYQSKDPNRALAQAAAVYGALQEQNIIYSVPPASFEKVGQRVRLCDAVLQQKMGTCLDLTLLYVACLEAIGLHPLMILLQGHIFGGVWLEELTFPEAVQDDVSLITKRLASGINELAVVECTAYVSGKNMSFDDARAAAEGELLGTDPVQYIIDISRARVSGIVPLPQRIQSEHGWKIHREKVDEHHLTSAPQEMQQRIEVDESGRTPIVVTRKQLWERKLLDLGLRNTLINMRFSRMIPLLTSSIDDLEDALADGSDFSILPHPADWHIAKDAIGFEMMHELGGMKQLIQAEFQSKRLRSVLSEGELAGKVKDLYRSARAALEENGANALYLAMGLLRWYETDRSTKPRYAPLILLPVELVRRGANRGYVIRLRDDEPQMNITMLEKLKQDFGIVIGGLDPLPQDEHGIDTRRVFTVIRKAVMGQKRWDVLESGYLGIFSFSQFVMWNDLRNRSDDLAKNKIVRSLMDGKLSWNAEPMELTDRISEEQVLLPLSADASQLYAIKEASKGKSFVLHGPPGTGKSQTITVLIANALAQGQSVLFVAEKMAALEVVQKRLANIGIGPFCLELHSNKSKKKDVLEQLRQAMEVTRNLTCEQYESKAEQIAELRKELDQYACALHRPLSCGMTLFELVNQYEENRLAPDLKSFTAQTLEQADAAFLDRQLTVTERLIAAAKAVKHPSGHPLEAVRCGQYSQKLRMELPEALSAYQRCLEQLEQAVKECSTLFELETPETDVQLKQLAELAEAFLPWTELPAAWARTENLNRYLCDVQEMAEHYQKAHTLRSKLAETWNPGFFDLDGQSLLSQFNTINSKWFLPKLMGMNGLVKQMAAYSNCVVSKELLQPAFASLIEYQRERKLADQLFQTYGDGMEHLYNGANTDWSRVLKISIEAKTNGERLDALVGGQQLRMQLGGQRQKKAQTSRVIEVWNETLTAKEQLNQLLEIADQTDAEHWIWTQKSLCNRILDHLDELKEWITWNSVAGEARELGLAPVVEAYRAGLPHEQVKSAYLKSMAKALAIRFIDAEPVLGTFSGAVFNEKIAQFKRIDQEVTELAQQEIVCRLAARVPDCTRQAAQSSELGILQRAIRSNGRGISIRKLFEQIPNLLPRLCPCMLMSPISAAQYLDPKREPFDMVVFDEASQLPTSKAVGALARGKNAVIVGDPKQMPPTSFFAVNTVDENNLDAEDLESILDDCLALNMPQTHLLWHYRSRHESLIAFSNNQFYENRLYTFPSVNDRESKVSLVHVDGVFDRGRTRQNQVEAEAVVAELVRRCHDGELSAFSVGVVTFNINQQNLIDDLLTEACKTDSELEKWAYESEEPLFIKNLENVQGDERDVILFSIGYGPDRDGRVSMNFGPLNRTGGWRRLNVAVSRARNEMKVFSSMTPDQINLSRSSAEGVAALKAFLEYADHGRLFADENTLRRYKKEQTGIASALCDALKEKGYATELSVGHSEYKVDIGVIDPREPNRYLLGILLDGESYGTSKTTRDREIAQIGVLNGLGWNTLRVWTMDWWDNSRKELNRILARLEELKVKPVKPALLPPKQKAAKATQTSAQRVSKNVTKAPKTSVVPERKQVSVPFYQPAKLKEEHLSAEEFVSGANIGRIQNKVQQVILQEAPVCEALLTRRVVQSFGITRAGNRIQNRMAQVYYSMNLNATTTNSQCVYWQSGQNPKDYTDFRASGSGTAKREARDVPVQEAANAICCVLYEQISLLQTDLIREAAKLMGYSRSGNVVTGLFTNAIQYAQQHNWIEIAANGNWVLCVSQMEKWQKASGRT